MLLYKFACGVQVASAVESLTKAMGRSLTYQLKWVRPAMRKLVSQAESTVVHITDYVSAAFDTVALGCDTDEVLVFINDSSVRLVGPLHTLISRFNLAYQKFSNFSFFCSRCAVEEPYKVGGCLLRCDVLATFCQLCI
jgi:hypothetical protein